MAFDFPSSPSDGQRFTPSGGPTYVYSQSVWKIEGSIGAPGNLSISDTPPPAPQVGQMWWESDTGNLFAYVMDANSSQWVQINVPALLTDYVKKTGDTMSGALTINSEAALTLSGTGPYQSWYGGGTRRGYIISSAATTCFSIFSENGYNMNFQPVSTLYVGPRTGNVAAACRVQVSYPGASTMFGINVCAEAVGGGTTYPMYFTYPPTTAVGTISINASATAYNTSSDERLKEFTGPLSGEDAIAIIRADPVRRFNWKIDGSAAVGWGAQTSYAISQDLATPGDDLGPEGRQGDEGFFPWGTDQAKRTPYLWAALTAALDRIEALEARIEALEAGGV